jgi:hypothetical protein
MMMMMIPVRLLTRIPARTPKGPPEDLSEVADEDSVIGADDVIIPTDVPR